MDEARGERVLAKTKRRLIPFMCVCFFVAFLDRTNVSIAKLQMNLRDDVYSLGFGIFFLGYFLFEVPSNMMLHKYGARIWIARIMIFWGLVSASFAFVGDSVGLFYVLRFLLGAGEAGFFPGMILYLTYWFPDSHRSKTIALFLTAAVMSSVIGMPVSGAILQMDGILGLLGWQWLFIIEGLPAVMLGFLVFALLPNGPATAKWLAPEERDWLIDRLAAERRAQHAQGGGHDGASLLRALTDPKVLLLSLLYFLMVIGGYGVDSFAPTLIKQSTGWTDNFHIGLLTAVPPLVAIFVMMILGRHSDETGERRWHVFASCGLGAVGLVIAAFATSPTMTTLGLALSVSGRWSAIAPFWAIPTAFLTGKAAAGGIAFINSIGNLGGFAGPTIMGWLRQATGSFSAGLLVLAASFVAAGGVALAARGRPGRAP